MRLEGFQKNFLRKSAQKLKPLVIVGKSGVGEPIRAALDENLLHHELVKVKYLDFKENKDVSAGLLASQTGSALIQIIGNVAIFYRQNSDPERRIYHLPKRDY
ncbi:MAG: ribosome assembly RNA-binding protein YhbY [Spirochaetales bacterium]|nr:ribosome assembly RNA-binding protein YhbY [Spirochaetales bacterium]